MHDVFQNKGGNALCKASPALQILYEDAYLIVAVKPAGILSESEGMPKLLAGSIGCERIFCVHRLDRDVGGVIVYAKDSATAANFSASIANHTIVKEYLTVVQGLPESPSGTLRDLLFHDAAKNKTYVVSRQRRGVREAALEYRLIATVQDAVAGPLSLLFVTLHTGRTHQIRVQFASRKLPVAGDRRYGSTLRDCNIALFSHGLSFAHPISGETTTLHALPPATWPWTVFSGQLQEPII